MEIPATEQLTTTKPNGILLTDKTLAHICGRVGVMVGNIVSQKLSGEIVIQFHEGVYQRSKATITHHI